MGNHPSHQIGGNMSREEMVLQVKRYIEDIYRCTTISYKTASDAMHNRTIAYGAMDFVVTLNGGYDEELARWWNDEMVDKFNELIREKMSK